MERSPSWQLSAFYERVFTRARHPLKWTKRSNIKTVQHHVQICPHRTCNLSPVTNYNYKYFPCVCVCTQWLCGGTLKCLPPLRLPFSLSTNPWSTFPDVYRMWQAALTNGITKIITIEQQVWMWRLEVCSGCWSQHAVHGRQRSCSTNTGQRSVASMATAN
jgi:hypothetical protein